jgi:hypothetical protein
MSGSVRAYASPFRGRTPSLVAHCKHFGYEMNMLDTVESHTIEYQRRLDNKLDRSLDCMVTAIDRLASIEKQAAGLQEDVARLDHRLDGFEKHLARIEKRLDLVESSAPGS